MVGVPVSGPVRKGVLFRGVSIVGGADIFLSFRSIGSSWMEEETGVDGASDVA